MKYSILLTGQLRTWEFLKPLIQNLRENHNIDIFLSIDLCNKQQHEYKNNLHETNFDELNKALDFYKPISYFSNYEYDESDFNKNIEDLSYIYQTKFKINKEEILEELFDDSSNLKFKSLYKEHHFKNNDYDKFDIDNIKKLSEQYFYVYKAYELLETHIKHNNIEYDAIIRLRFDQIIWNDKFYFSNTNILPSYENKEILINKMKNIKLKLDVPEFNNICVFGGGVFENYGYVNDQFWCHHKDKISIMKNFYIKLPYIIQNSLKTFWPCHGCWIEHFFAKYLFDNNLKIKRSILNGIYIREFT